MYWCVVACVWTWEQWGEWSVAWCALFSPLFTRSLSRLVAWATRRADRRGLASSRFPFYHEVKTLFLLWLALPQIQVRLCSSLPRSQNLAT